MFHGLRLINFMRMEESSFVTSVPAATKIGDQMLMRLVPIYWVNLSVIGTENGS